MQIVYKMFFDDNAVSFQRLLNVDELKMCSILLDNLHF